MDTARVVPEAFIVCRSLAEMEVVLIAIELPIVPLHFSFIAFFKSTNTSPPFFDRRSPLAKVVGAALYFDTIRSMLVLSSATAGERGNAKGSRSGI